MVLDFRVGSDESHVKPDTGSHSSRWGSVLAKTLGTFGNFFFFSSQFLPFAQNGRVKAPDAGPEYLLHSEMGNPGSERAAPDKPAVLWKNKRENRPFSEN